MKIEQIPVMTALKSLSSSVGRDWEHSLQRRPSKKKTTSILVLCIATVTTRRLKREKRNKENVSPFFWKTHAFRNTLKFACHLSRKHQETLQVEKRYYNFNSVISKEAEFTRVPTIFLQG